MLISILSLWLAFASPAKADDRSVSYSTWSLAGQSVMLKFELPVSEAVFLVGTDLPLLTVAKLRDYLIEHVGVQAAGRNCPAIDQGYDLGRVDPLDVGPGRYGFEILFHCEALRDLTLRDTVLFDRVPTHVNFVRIQVGGRFTEQLFTRGQQTLQVGDIAAPPAAGLGRYLGLGARDVLTGFDHWCVLLVLLLLSARMGASLIAVATALAAGYGVALIVALGGWLEPRPGMQEAAIALLAVSGALAGPAGLMPASNAPQRLYLPALLAGAFAFVDGFMLPAQVAPLQLPRPALLHVLAGGALGALLAAVFVALLLTAVRFFLRRKFAALSPLLHDVAVAGCGALGAFWLLSRLYG
jgi:hypothetical protein